MGQNRSLVPPLAIVFILHPSSFILDFGPPAPANDPDWAFLQAAQRSPAMLSMSQGDIGKPIWIRARWISTRGQPGPWSPMQNAVIA